MDQGSGLIRRLALTSARTSDSNLFEGMVIGDEAAWLVLGFAYANLGRWGEAIEAYREALRLKSDYANAWINLAAAYVLSGNRSAALEAVKELRRYDPKKAEELSKLIPP